jgi:hypothetical protein
MQLYMEGESCWLSAPRGGLKTEAKESIVIVARVVEEIQAVIELFEEFQKRSKLP